MGDRPRLALGGGLLSSAERRRRFQAAHPGVIIVAPPTIHDYWSAIVGRGLVPGDPDATSVGSWALGGLMDQLEEIYQDEDAPAGRQGTAGT